MSEQSVSMGGDTGDRGAASTDNDPWITLRLTAPLVVAVGAVILFEGRVLGADTGGTLFTFVVFAVLLVGVAGTLALWDAAAAECERGGDWTPDPRYYVGGGALGVLAASLLMLDPLPTGEALVVTLAGASVVAVLAASVVAGPVFLLQRWRHR